MENETNLSNVKINSIISSLSSSEKSDGEKVQEILDKHLTAEQAGSIRNFIKDEEKMKKLLSSPLAKAFMDKYLKNGE